MLLPSMHRSSDASLRLEPPDAASQGREPALRVTKDALTESGVGRWHGSSLPPEYSETDALIFGDSKPNPAPESTSVECTTCRADNIIPKRFLQHEAKGKSKAEGLMRLGRNSKADGMDGCLTPPLPGYSVTPVTTLVTPTLPLPARGTGTLTLAPPQMSAAQNLMVRLM